MNNPVRVLESATRENLFPQGYILANKDVGAACGKSEKAARLHFETFGCNEHRKQVTRDFLGGMASERRAAKFDRFRGCFISVPAGSVTFPIQFGMATENVSEYESESAHPTADIFAAELRANPEKLFADIGAGFRDVVYENCLYVEVYQSLTTDVTIQPTCELPFKTGSLDGIGCFAVLEHVRWPWKMAAEIARVVKPGGKVFIDWPFLAPLHGYPSHYYNATREGVRALFDQSFDIIELTTGAHQGPNFTITWVLTWLLDRISDSSIRSRIASKTVAELAAEPPQGEFWRNVMGALDDDAISALSCGNRLFGKRNEKSVSE